MPTMLALAGRATCPQPSCGGRPELFAPLCKSTYSARHYSRGLMSADSGQRYHAGRRGMPSRVLYYSLGPWFAPSESCVEIHRIDATVTASQLNELVQQPYAYFFEPTPYPAINAYDPIVMAGRLRASAGLVPHWSAAFVSHESPIPFEAQSAFAAQVGHVLGSMPELRLVTPPERPVPNTRIAKGQAGPDIVADWVGALDSAIRGDEAGDRISDMTQEVVALYLAPCRGLPKFSPTQRRLLHRASTGELGIIAEDVAADLDVQLVTAQRAIRGIALALFAEESGRRSPELVGRLVAQYGWFFRYNKA